MKRTLLYSLFLSFIINSTIAQFTVAEKYQIDSLAKKFDEKTRKPRGNPDAVVITSQLEDGSAYEIYLGNVYKSMLQQYHEKRWTTEQVNYSFDQQYKSKITIFKKGKIIVEFSLYESDGWKFVELDHGSFKNVPDKIMKNLITSLTCHSD